MINHSSLVRIALFLLLLSTAARDVLAAETKLPPVPKAEQIDEARLGDASRAAVACGVEYLLGRLETNDLNVVVSPVYRKSFRKAYTVHYAKKMVEQPIYEYEYEEVFVSQEDSSGNRSLVKTKRIKPGSAKQKGSKKVEGLVIDPKGDIVKEYPEVKTPEHWQVGFLGQNAMALYTLLKAGVPETHPAVSKLADKLRIAVIDFGAPDQTWDLAWMTAAFSCLRDERFNFPRERVVNKLLDGQILDGAGRGLWGPLSINASLFAAMLSFENDLRLELDKRKKDAAKRPDSKSLAKKIEEAERIREEFSKQYSRVTQQGLRFEKAMEGWVMIDTQIDPEGGLTSRGLPFYIFNQTIADLESTAVALFAIAEAQTNGCLPARTWRPEVSKGRPLTPPETPDAILARSAAAIAKLQQKDGSWAEGNVHVPLTQFAALKFRALDRKSLFNLESRQTFASSGQSLAALLDVGRVVGLPKLMGRYSETLMAGEKAVETMAETFLDTDVEMSRVGRFTAPYDFLFSARRLQRVPDAGAQKRRAIRDRLAYRAILMQASDGAWDDGLAVAYSSGMMAYIEELMKIRHEEEQAKLAKEKRQPFNRNYQWNRYIGWTLGPHALTAPVVSTCYSMLFLMDGMEGAAPWPMQKPEGDSPFVARTGAVARLTGQDVPRVDPPAAGAGADAKPAAGPEPDAKPKPPAEDDEVKIPVVAPPEKKAPAADEVW